MPFVRPPDAKTALLDVIKTIPEVTGICPVQYITGKLPETAGSNPIPWITATSAGGPRRFSKLPIKVPRLDLRTYGVNAYEAKRLALTIEGGLDPLGQGIGVQRTAHSATVLDITFETDEPLEGIENGWYFCVWPMFVAMLRTASS